jgi:hypothetical protein
MTIFVYGDQTEAAKYRSTVEHYLSEMTRIFGQTSRNQSYWRQLSDTAKVHLRLINGQPFAYLYAGDNLQGFVIGLQNGAILPEGFDVWKLATLLQDAGTWSMKKQPYNYGNDPPSPLPYSIAPDNTVIFTYADAQANKGATIYKKLKVWIPPDDPPSTYLDGEPLCLDDNTLVLHRDKIVVPVINSVIDPMGWKVHEEFKYEWTDEIIVSDLELGMLVTLWRYDSPPIVRRFGTSLKFYFLLMNETLVATVQRFQLTLNASLLAPYVVAEGLTTEARQEAGSEFIQSAGRTFTSGGEPSSSIGGMDAHGLCVWGGGGDGALWSIIGFAGAGNWGTSPNYSSWTWAASGTNTSTIALDSGLDFTVKRDMSASASGGSGTTSFYGTNDTGGTIWLGNLDVDTRTHGYVPSSSSWEGTLPGDPVGNVGATEAGDRLDANSDTASTCITCLQLPADIQKTTHSSRRAGYCLEAYKYNKAYNIPSSDVNWGGDPRYTLYTYSRTSSTTYTILQQSYLEFKTTIEARDYIYCDLDERVFMYIELVATGTYAADFGSSGIGSSDFTLNFCMDYRGQKFSKAIYSGTMATSIFIPVKFPDDVNFGTAATEVRFTVPNPAKPKLIFAPKWTTQNQCPHIAYRTLSEIGTLDSKGKPIPDEMLFTMRFQLYRERRVLDDSPLFPTEAVVPPEGTVTLKVPLIEHTARTHGFQVKSLFDNLELLWPTVSLSIPESTDWLADVLPADWSRPSSDDDEPTTGTFTKNSGDLSTWNIYRT